MSKVQILDKQGKKSETLDLPEGLFPKYVNKAVLYQAVNKYRASLRQGNASTKERADVSGGGRKPHRQKGTGTARAGSTRSPLWIGGGVTFGPHPRDFSYSIPKKIRKVALRESLNAKIKCDDLVCIDDIKEPFQKTKEFAQLLKNLSLEGKVLGILDGSDASIQRVSKNISRFQLMRSEDVNAFNVLGSKKILVSKTALQNLLSRVKLDKSPSKKGKVSKDKKPALEKAEGKKK